MEKFIFRSSGRFLFEISRCFSLLWLQLGGNNRFPGIRCQLHAPTPKKESHPEGVAFLLG
jgi:hypothetical protein